MGELKLAYLCEKCERLKDCKKKVYVGVEIKSMYCPNFQSKKVVDKK